MTGTHDNLTVVETMNYCKADVKSGSPLVVMDLINKTKSNTYLWMMDLWDEDGNPVRLQCEFDKPNRHGARAVLKVLR